MLGGTFDPPHIGHLIVASEALWRLELDVVGSRTEVPQLVGVRQPDLLLVNDDDLTFAKIRLDERSWLTATEHIGDLVDPLPRALVWSAAWDMTRADWGARNKAQARAATSASSASGSTGLTR